MDASRPRFAEGGSAASVASLALGIRFIFTARREQKRN